MPTKTRFTSQQFYETHDRNDNKIYKHLTESHANNLKKHMLAMKPTKGNNT